MNYVGIDWAYGRAAFCAVGEAGTIAREGLIRADEDGLAKLVLELGTDVRACVEMMSGAVWVRDQLELAGWSVQVAHARKVRWGPTRCRRLLMEMRIHEAKMIGSLTARQREALAARLGGHRAA